MRYVIASPPYRHNSAGIRTLYELQKNLIRIGEDAIVINIPIPCYDDDVLVIPECMQRRDFNAKNVVRYYLNCPIQGIEYRDDEFKLAYNPSDLCGKEDFLLTIRSMEPFFKNYGYERPFKAIYIGKGKYRDLPVFNSPEFRTITGDWPPTRYEVADFLNRCSILYSFDNKTVVVTEAQLCGCATKLINDDDTITDTTEESSAQVQREPVLKCLEKLTELNILLKGRFFDGRT